MARMNRSAISVPLRTHEGAPAKRISALQQLQRSVLATLLWEDEFYEDGKKIADRIAELVEQVDPADVAQLAMDARNLQHLRHAPLWLVVAMAKHKTHRHLVANTLEVVVQRADELAEFLALYWKDQKDAPLAAQVKKGLAKAFQKFDAYQLAKNDHAGAGIKLRDVMFLVHPTPKDLFGGPARPLLPVGRKGYQRGLVLRHEYGQGLTFKQLAENSLPTPDTWEVALSTGEVKKDAWERLLKEQKLGPMALIRNLRNMVQANVDDGLIRGALVSMKADKVLPFRFIAAVRHAPSFAGELESAMLRNLEGASKLPGRTILLVDVSGSMDVPLSAKSDMKRVDVAAGLAVLAREICQHVTIATFSDYVREVPAWRGLGLVDAIQKSQPHSGTDLGAAVAWANGRTYDRVIVLTDEQSHTRVPSPKGQGYVINVASYKNGIGYGPWTHIDGWSERVLDYIREYESVSFE